MRLKWKGKTVFHYSQKRLVYALCFLLFCIIDQRIKTCSGLDGWLETFRDLTGVGMAVVIISHYRLEDFRKRKIPYVVWSALSATGAVAAFLWGRDNRPFLNDWVVVIVDVILFGYIVIHTFIDVVLEKRCPKLNKKFFAVWVVMMVLMVVSRSTYIWPLCYLVMFGCFYLTDYSEEEQKDLLQGMLDGIILGFFVLQGLCFVFRPYDIVRYQGIYHNPNLNALFYLEVLAAVLMKIIYVTKNHCSKWIKAYYWLGAGVVLAFEFMTIGRTGWLTAAVLVFFFLWMMRQSPLGKKAWKNMTALVVCFVIAFPLCFGAVRYLPPVFHHPIWFWGEWNEARVHSWDAWDSEKYVELDEFADVALGRVLKSFEDVIRHSPLALRAEAAGNKIPVLTYEESLDGLLVRSTIYKYYFSHLNWNGHPYEEQGFKIVEGYWIGHAHNIFLQYGTDFGILVLALFALLAVWAVLGAIRNYKRIHNEVYASGVLFLLIPFVFGMFEYSWGVGSLTILMLYVMWRNIVCDSVRKEQMNVV